MKVISVSPIKCSQKLSSFLLIQILCYQQLHRISSFYTSSPPTPPSPSSSSSSTPLKLLKQDLKPNMYSMAGYTHRALNHFLPLKRQLLYQQEKQEEHFPPFSQSLTSPSTFPSCYLTANFMFTLQPIPLTTFLQTV